MKKGLGKGLGALLPENTERPDHQNAGVMEVDINLVEPNRDQPRKYFEDAALHDLSESIASYGILQPLLVKKEDGFFTIIAGERRWRAARLAKLSKVPVVVREFNDAEVLQVALIENIQRMDLNPIEEAASYQRLIEEYGMTQEDVAEKLGKSRSAIANTIRILKLDARVQTHLMDNKLSAGHARALLPLDPDKQLVVAEQIMEEVLNVRETESLVQALLSENKSPEEKLEKLVRNPELHLLERQLQQLLGAKVNIREKGEQGTIQIRYHSPEDLDRLLCLMKKVEE